MRALGTGGVGKWGHWEAGTMESIVARPGALACPGRRAGRDVRRLDNGRRLPQYAAPPAPSVTPNSAPPGRDTTVPLDPAHTVQRGNQTIQVQPIRRTRTADGHEVVADRIIVGFRPGVSDAEKATYTGRSRKRRARRVRSRSNESTRARNTSMSPAHRRWMPRSKPIAPTPVSPTPNRTSSSVPPTRRTTRISASSMAWR